MLKQISMICLFIFLVAPVNSLIGCSSDNKIDINEVPCQGITNVMSCTDKNVSELNQNTSVQRNLTTLPIGDGRFNFTFNSTSFATYSLVACDNSSATIVVGNFQDFYDRVTYLYFFTAFLAIGFIGYGHYDQRFQSILGILGGMMFAILGLVLFLNGTPDITNSFMKDSLSIVFTGIGLYFIVADPLNQYLVNDRGGN